MTEAFAAQQPRRRRSQTRPHGGIPHEGRSIVIALVMLGVLIALGIAVMLGWTADSRDDTQKLWPLERRRPVSPMPAPARHDCGLHNARPAAAPQAVSEPIPRPATRRSR